MPAYISETALPRLNTKAIDRTRTRLASGKRVNGASDDAAGLSIGTRMTAQILGTKQAKQNSLDAISLTQTAEGVLGEKVQILQRMRELLVYASNDVLEEGDRAAIQEELEVLSVEVNDMNATFNDREIFRDSFNFAVDTSVKTLDLNLSLARLSSESAGMLYKQVGNHVDTTIGLDQGSLQFKLGGETLSVRASRAGDDQISTVNAANSALAKAAAINDSVGQFGIQALARDTVVEGSVVRAVTLDADNYFEINGQKISGFDVQEFDVDHAMQRAINAVVDETGVVATANGEGALILTAADGRNIQVRAVGDASRIGFNDEVFGGQICILAERSCDLDLADAQTAQCLGLFNNSSGDALSVDFTDAGGAASLEGGTTTGLWHLSQQRSVSGPDALRYADPATNNFNTGATNSGEFVTSNIDLTAATSAALSFDYFMNTETGNTYDLLSVAVRTGGGDVAVLSKSDFTVDSNFHNIDVNLSAFAGQNINLVFSFDTVDSAINNGEGVYLDNILVTQDAPQLTFSLGRDHTADLSDLNLNSSAEREETLVSIDYALRRFSQARGELGALHNSLESHINTLDERINSTSAARSRIIDADVAHEVADLARAQITQAAAREVHAFMRSSLELIVSLMN